MKPRKLIVPAVLALGGVGVVAVGLAHASDMPSVQPFVDRLARDATITNIVLILLIIRAEWRDWVTNRRLFEVLENFGEAISDLSESIKTFHSAMREREEKAS